MGKIKTIFVCESCGAQHSAWMGRCSACGEWNTIIEERKLNLEEDITRKEGVSFYKISQELEKVNVRTKTGFSEFDGILGGGIVKGSLNLLSGEPGVGKSTLVLQLIHNLEKEGKKKKILYVSGEESVSQIQIRAQRISETMECFSSLEIASDSNVDEIIYSIEKLKPDFLVIDSIQSVYSSTLSSYPGSVSQVRYCTNIILRTIKKLEVDTFLIGQVTKEGVIAGPKILEHLVDVVLQLEGSEKEDYRILRCLKNRFGSTEEIGIFEMEEKGLKEIINPAAIFLDNKDLKIAGSVKTVFLEGKRSLLAEIQALVVSNYFPPLRRVAMGINYNRLLLIVAVLERRLGIKLQNKDIYVKVSGGIKVDDPAIDLAVCIAIISAYGNKIIDEKAVFLGEVGLLGEIRKVKQFERRKKEAEKQGFYNIFGPDKFDSLSQVQQKLQLF